MSSDLQMIHKVTVKLEETLQEINKMLSEHLKSNKTVLNNKKNDDHKKSKDDSKKTSETKVKRPLTAFFLFSSEQRENIQKQYPDMPITQVSSNLGKIWGKLGEDEKKPYIDRAEKALKKFYEEHPEQKGKKKSKKNKE